LYCNDGDWVESLTALVEHADGRLEIIAWAQHQVAAPVPQAVPAAEGAT
ncbi:MAG: UDP-2,3-diacylglucosamine diphosphatase, partial [Rubrivivax sp.]|nr:UDP-2,3-diacylglucosamine diphosphatase [Rubrivivax sp.]